ncbi:heterokaryon incompatibility protein-domain-containing protein [Biscogniauxia sp. FL1348]|nr:heterokaryon incompatibility protein-domain-containing protein [Biscogniauxia sp. FL1348]
MALTLLQIFGLGTRGAYPGGRLRADAEIRILKRKSIENGHINCKFKHITLSLNKHKPLKVGYYALSYRWGDAADPKAITCNGASFNVQKGLHAALIQIWSRSPEMLLWVDAICIDQTDITERSMQVSMMGLIYHKALGVLIWLGEADHYTELAWAALKQASSLARQSSTVLKAGLTQIGPIETIWFSLHKLARHEWFYRAWTFQELYLAQHAEILCSQLEMDWNTFHHTMESIKDCLEDGPASVDSSRAKVSIQKLLSSVERLWFSDSAFTLTDLLVKTIHRDCEDPRDKLYALLGVLFRKEGLWTNSAIEVNYGISRKKLYTSVAHSLVWRAKWTEPGRTNRGAQPHDLHILHGAGLDIHENYHQTSRYFEASLQPSLSLPSWVIDWKCSEASTIWADRTYVRRSEWHPIIRTNGIKLGAAIHVDDQRDQGSYLRLYGVAIARLVKPKVSSSSRDCYSDDYTRLDLEDLPHCSYKGKPVSEDPFLADKIAPQNYTRWTSETPEEDKKRYPKDTLEEIYGADNIIRSLPSHDRKTCRCCWTPYFDTIITTFPVLILSLIFPPWSIYFFLLFCWVAFKDSLIEARKPSRRFCIDIKVQDGYSTRAEAGDWIVSLAGEQGLFLLKPTKNGNFKLVRGLLCHANSNINWKISRIDVNGRIDSGWISNYHGLDEDGSTIPSWHDFQVVPVSLTIE